MERNTAKRPLIDMTPEQFRSWLLPIVEHSLFIDRERLVAALMAGTDRQTLTETFRQCFEGYYYDVAFALDCHESCIFSILDSSDVYNALKHRIAVVESKRKASQIGREARRMGSCVRTDSVPSVKVTALSNRAFREFLHTLVKSEFFAAQERVIKLLNMAWTDTSKSSVHETTDVADIRLREAVYEFFVCHLEFEQFLEDYEYDPDEGVQIRSEIDDELEQSITDHEAGKVKGRSLQDVAKEFGVTLKCTQ